MRLKIGLVVFALLLASCAQATPWCSVGAASGEAIRSLQIEAGKLSADHPRAMAHIHTEGTLPHQGIRDQSLEAKKDLTLMFDLALMWRDSHDKAALERLVTLLDAWAGVYQPSFNPIDETAFDQLIDAYAITQADLPDATRSNVAKLIHVLGSGYIEQMQHPLQPGKSSWSNNWESHRIKLATLAAVALGDARMFDAAREQFRKQIGQNLHPDGMSIDFEERDALHYTVYDLEPLTRAAMAAHARGEDWMNLKGENNATLAAALNWLLPYTSGEKRHEEYVHTTVKFDLQRRDAGVVGFSGPWEPAKSGELYWMASTLDARYLPLAQSLIQQPPWMEACWQAQKGNAGLSQGTQEINAALPLLAIGASHQPLRSMELDIASIDRERILKVANAALALPPISITYYPARFSTGGLNDYYSNGDYWWPDPAKPHGLPYILHDGQTNPENFNQHRLALRALRDAVAALGAAYRITGDDRYAGKAAALLRVFFLDPATRMNPHLKFAQAIPGVSPGRGIGIIDTLHLIEVPEAIAAMQKSGAFAPETLAGLKQWFRDYTEWMLTSENGHDEATTKNNHAVAFWLQVAVYARFTGDEARLAETRRQFKEVFVPNQMATDGSFPLELKRTKPYAYSIFQLDNMATLCQVLTTPADNLWSFTLPDGRGIRKAVAYLQPFLADKSSWPLKPDVQAWDGWPTRQASLLFAGLAYDDQVTLALWKKLPPDPTDEEVQRNIAITQPILWLQDFSAALPPMRATSWH